MSKAKKHKTPKIDPRVLTRPRLDALFERHARGELDDDGLQTSVQSLMAEAGQPSVLDALVKRMEGTPEAERETLMALVERLKSREVIDYLWQQVKKPRALSLDAKMTALVILRGMGEEVDISDPSRYFSPRDIKPSDIKSAEELFRMGVRGLARHLRDSRDAVEVEAYMLHIGRMPENALGGKEILLGMVKQSEDGASDLEADFLYALGHTTPFPDVQQAAERALDRLAVAGVKPITRVILELGQNRFHAAYMTDPDHPWQQSVAVAWERAGGIIQALVFLLDFGVPWRGALKDMFATRGMTPQQFQREYIERSEKKMGEHQYRVGLARAQATIAAAVEANKKSKIPLPKEFNEMRHLVDRWVLRPPAAVVAADTTRDELAHLPLVPDRSGKPLMVDMRDLEHNEALKSLITKEAEDEEWDEKEEEEFEDEFDRLASFADVVEHVKETYADLDNLSRWWRLEWVIDYLASLSPNPHDLDRSDDEFEFIIDQWWELKQFAMYLDGYAHEFHAVDDLRGFHLSEYLAEEADMDDYHGLSRAETVRDFFDYLAQRGLIPTDLPFLRDLPKMLAQPDTLTLFPRPEPLGGEIAVWFPLFGDEERDEPFTYNEWWMALVLEKKFKRNRDKCRREAGKKPDAAAKLVLLDRLQNRLTEEPEYLDALGDERLPTAADYKRAEKWFDWEKVNEARAW